MSTHLFTVAGADAVDLNLIAASLRLQIDGLPPGKSKLAAQQLNTQNGVESYLVVVRGHETPHIHPDGDLIITVLEGGGYLELSGGKADAPAGSVIVVPKGVCHAYFNKAHGDSMLLATFSPKNSKADCPTTS